MNVLLDNTDLFGPFFLVTIEVFALSATGCLVLGSLLALLRVCPVPALRLVATTYVTLIRNTPVTLIFLFVTFAYPLLRIVNLSYFAGAVVSLTVYEAAFICEVLRSGINTVPIGEVEAGRALGMSFVQTFGRVIFPQAARSVVPPLMTMLIALLKNTTIASGFSVAEAGAIREYLSERGANQLIGLAWVALGFVILVAGLSLVQRQLERRWRLAR